MPQFDVVGVGLNATDTLLVVPHFPAYAGKVPFQEEVLSPGGQVASAMVTCARLGLRTKYIGTLGDDQRGQIQMESLLKSGINLDDVQVRRNCPNQSAYIPVTVDVDTIYHGFDRVLPLVDYLIASSEFPVQWTNERDPFKALAMIQEEYRIPVAA